MSFKEDADFARFLTMGVYGAWAIKNDLESRGHRIIELERFALANKIWSIKVKRLRIPDLLCISCGRRFESKAKSKLEIRLSHSSADGREWFGGGMRKNDVFAFVRVSMTELGPEIGRPLYLTRESLEEATGTLKEGTRKAISEGSETDVKWPAWVPSYSGTLIGWSQDDPMAVVVKTDAGVVRTYRGANSWPKAYLYLAPGESFEGGSTIVAGPVAPTDPVCPGETWDWSRDFWSSDRTERYAAIKATRSKQAGELVATVEALLSQEDDWRVKLEAMALLASYKPEPWLMEIFEMGANVELPLEQQMEAVLVLSEIAHPQTAAFLYNIAQPSRRRHQEIRAAAAWGLGQGASPDPSRLLYLAADTDDRVALHAAAALPDDLPPDILATLLSWIKEGDERKAAIAATLLARREHVPQLLEVASGTGVGALFALRALGDLPRRLVEARAGRRLTEDEVRLLNPIWIQQRDWLRRRENVDAIEILAYQRIRFKN